MKMGYKADAPVAIAIAMIIILEQEIAQKCFTFEFVSRLYYINLFIVH